MLQTVRLSSCVSAQGEIVEVLRNGDVVVRDGGTLWRGRPIEPAGDPKRPAVLTPIRPVPGTCGE
jgi:hypothetical protein